jgi:hypothetical protein
MAKEIEVPIEGCRIGGKKHIWRLTERSGKGGYDGRRARAIMGCITVDLLIN